ncbi:Afadin and alpha-actinin-binding-domain-containing protein [Chlamydoabsidia padenii]|nr:Afadin and alpha-actinin-binding-domain-containing protein [Chlamydoabsidia padenii]
MEEGDFDVLDSSSESSFEEPLTTAQQNLVNQLEHQPGETNGQPMGSSSSTSRSIDVKANYVNLLLTAYGYSAPLIFNSNDGNDVIKVLDCFQTVLQDIKAQKDEHDQMNDTILTLQQEQEHLQNSLDRQHREQVKLEQELAHARNKTRSIEEEAKKTLENHRRIKEELNKCKNNMQYINQQYMHETRRHEQEHAKTRDRLTKMMKDKITTNVVSMTINDSALISELDLEPETSPMEDAISMHKDLLQKCTRREMESRAESEDLRTAVIKMHTSIYQLVESQIEGFKHAVGAKKLGNEADRDLEKYKLPADFHAQQIMGQVNMLLDTLREEWDRQITNRNFYTEEDMEEKELTIQQWQAQVTDLEEALDKLQKEHDEKEKVHLRFVNGGFFDEYPPEAYLDLSDSESSIPDNDRATESHYQQLRKKAMKDQEKITKAAIDLGNERMKLEAEQWAFREMKRQAALTELMDSTTLSSPQSRKRPRSDD